MHFNYEIYRNFGIILNDSTAEMQCIMLKQRGKIV